MMSILYELEGFFSSKLSAAKALVCLAKLEARLAGLSLFPLLLTWCGMLVVLMTCWLTAMSLVSYGVFLASHQIWVALSATLGLNLLVMGLLLYYFLFNLKLMSFEKTRAYLNSEPLQRGQLDDESSQTRDGSHHACQPPAVPGTE